MFVVEECIANFLNPLARHKSCHGKQIFVLTVLKEQIDESTGVRSDLPVQLLRFSSGAPRKIQPTMLNCQAGPIEVVGLRCVAVRKRVNRMERLLAPIEST